MELKNAFSLILAISMRSSYCANANDIRTEGHLRKLKKSSKQDEVKLKPLPIDPEEDFGEPDWLKIIEIAFPPWKNHGPCGSLTEIGGDTVEVPHPERKNTSKGKWNPCYYTKRFAGLDPDFGGYPTPIDTRYPYEFAAPFFGQPGDGSTHHCPFDSDPLITSIAACPKIDQCEDQGDCAKVEEYGIGHIPPFVPLGAIKQAYEKYRTKDIICNEWFDYDLNRCDIKKDVLDELVFKYYGTEDGTIVFQPPVLLPDDDGKLKPSNTYFKLEYGGGPPDVCPSCRGPHYCTDPVVSYKKGIIWGDFCPYVHTGPKSGQYRHPHIGLAALQQWIANQCMPEKCDEEWDEGAYGYPPVPEKSTSITWCEMKDNSQHWSQPKVPYEWPIKTESLKGNIPGPVLYDFFKPAGGQYINDFVMTSTADTSD